MTIIGYCVTLSLTATLHWLNQIKFFRLIKYKIYISDFDKIDIYQLPQYFEDLSVLPVIDEQ